jgi:6-phospho-3-hexuloisomerase
MESTSARASQGATQLAACLGRVNPSQLDALENAIVSANRVFVMGAGRSMLMLRAFAMRLMHLGLTVYIVGDTTTPAFGPEDLLVAGSGSGTTSGVVNVVKKAKDLGGSVACFTIKADSPLGDLSDYVVEIPAYTDKEDYEGMEKPVLPGGSEFESSILLLGDSMVVPLGEKLGIPTDHAFKLHANLE